jgi:hypothetical protein
MSPDARMLEREEYVEQAYFFRMLGERMRQNMPAQELLAAIREEILATTKLPMAIDFMAAELRHKGVFAPAFVQLSHYFTPFQAFVITESESERGKFDLFQGLEILQREAKYRAEGATPQAIFVYEFESLCRNRLGYDRGLAAVAGDPIFDDAWREWIFTVRRQVGLVDFADLIYVRSQHYWNQHVRRTGETEEPSKPILFGEPEGRIALANRKKDPLLLFGALHRQLGYPEVPRLARIDESSQILPALLRRVDRLEAHIKLLEEERKEGGLDLAKFFGPGRFEDIPPGSG